MPGRLQDKVSIITGASSGLGRAIALTYAKEGAHVVCADLKPEGQANASESDKRPTHEVITQALGGKAVFVRVDVGDSQSVQDLVQTAVKEFGRLDMWVGLMNVDYS